MNVGSAGCFRQSAAEVTICLKSMYVSGLTSHVCPRDVSRMSQVRRSDVSRMSQVCLSDVSVMSQIRISAVRNES